jgi:hypothetical protein
LIEIDLSKTDYEEQILIVNPCDLDELYKNVNVAMLDEKQKLRNEKLKKQKDVRI